MRGAHLREDLVQPLERPVQMYLNPAGGAGHILTVVFSTPSLRRGQHYILAVQAGTLYNSKNERVNTGKVIFRFNIVFKHCLKTWQV